jgi:hypothetical protein
MASNPSARERVWRPAVFVAAVSTIVILTGAPAKAAQPLAASPSTALADDDPSNRFRFDFHLTALGAMSNLTGAASQCGNVVGQVQQINPALATTCSFPSRAASLAAGGGVGITSFAAIDVRYHRVARLSLAATAPIDATTNLNDTVAFGPVSSWELVGVGSLPIGRFVLYAEAGGSRWRLRQTAALTVIGSGQTLLNSSNATTAADWSPLWGAGIRVRLVRHVSTTVGYERVTMRTAGLRQSYNELRVGGSFSTK